MQRLLGNRTIRPGLLADQTPLPHSIPRPPIEDIAAFDAVMRDPVAFAKLWFDSWLWKKQAQGLRSVRDNRNTAISSGNGVGKTEIAAIAASWWLTGKDGRMVVTTAPTDKQNVKVLWARIATHYEIAKRKTVQFPSGRSITGFGGTLLQKEWRFAPNWFGLAASAKRPENFPGFHAPGGVLAIIEEASGVPDEIFRAAKKIVTGKNDRMLAIGNPTQTMGYFHDIWHKPEVIPEWNRIEISSLELTDDDRKRIPGLVASDWLDAVIREFGADSDYVRMTILGKFPRGGDRMLMAFDDIQYAMTRDDVEYFPGDDTRKPEPIVIAVDMSRGGEDKTAITRVAGNIQTHLEKYAGEDTKDTTITRRRVEKLFHDQGADAIVVDVVGLGGPVYDELKDLNYPVIAFAANAVPLERPDMFVDLASESYWIVAMDVKDRFVQLIYDDELRGQLWDQPYEYKRGKIKIVGKEERYKKGRKSPDCSDAYVMARFGQRIVMKERAEAMLRPEFQNGQ